MSHLWRILEDRPRCRASDGGGPRSSYPDVDFVRAIVAAGCHGELNRRIRDCLASFDASSERLMPVGVTDDEHSGPGVLLPDRAESAHHRRGVRFLRGGHDIDAFVREAGRDVLKIVRTFHAEVVGGRSPDWPWVIPSP